MSEIVLERDWEHAGLRCVCVMTSLGHRCGYVGLPAGHALHGARYHSPAEILGATEYDWRDEKFASPGERIKVHGGITYADDGGHLPIEPNGLWWFGFDCGHIGDAPAPGSKRDKLNQRYGLTDLEHNAVHRSEEYVVDQCNKMAEQLAAFAAPEVTP